nr:reverse transcriptase domain-containing protein [Tanacetum cinerariifolium]
MPPDMYSVQAPSGGVTYRDNIQDGVAFQGPTIPTPSKVVKQGTKVTKDQVQTPSSQSTAPVQPPVIQSEAQTPVSEPVIAPKLSEMARTPMNEHCLAVILNKLPRKPGDPGKFLIPCEFPGMDECLTLADLEYSQEVFCFFDVTASGNLTPYDDLIISTTSPTLTPFRDNDFLLFEEADAFLGLEDDPNSQEFNPFYYHPEGDILLLKAILNSEPLPPLLNHEQYILHSRKNSRCMLAIFHDMVEKTMEVFIDDFSVFGNSFENCLSRLDKMLQ